MREPSKQASKRASEQASKRASKQARKPRYFTEWGKPRKHFTIRGKYRHVPAGRQRGTVEEWPARRVPRKRMHRLDTPMTHWSWVQSHARSYLSLKIALLWGWRECWVVFRSATGIVSCARYPQLILRLSLLGMQADV
jgi:hypothetical protein